MPHSYIFWESYKDLNAAKRENIDRYCKNLLREYKYCLVESTDIAECEHFNLKYKKCLEIYKSM